MLLEVSTSLNSSVNQDKISHEQFYAPTVCCLLQIEKGTNETALVQYSEDNSPWLPITKPSETFNIRFRQTATEIALHGVFVSVFLLFKRL